MLIFAAALCIREYIKNKKVESKRLLYLTIFSSVSLWVASDIFPWDVIAYSIPPLRPITNVQFPWRYLLAATVLTGVLQILAGWLRLGSLMRFVSRSVVTGFVNALAILIFMAQLPELDPARVGLLTYALVAAALAIIYLFPKVTRAVPSPLVTILIITALVWATGWDVRTVGDMGALPDTLPR